MINDDAGKVDVDKWDFYFFPPKRVNIHPASFVLAVAHKVPSAFGMFGRDSRRKLFSQHAIRLLMWKCDIINDTGRSIVWCDNNLTSERCQRRNKWRRNANPMNCWSEKFTENKICCAGNGDDESSWYHRAITVESTCSTFNVITIKLFSDWQRVWGGRLQKGKSLLFASSAALALD